MWTGTTLPAPLPGQALFLGHGQDCVWASYSKAFSWTLSHLGNRANLIADVSACPVYTVPVLSIRDFSEVVGWGGQQIAASVDLLNIDDKTRDGRDLFPGCWIGCVVNNGRTESLTDESSE